jgi:hypothetical protein
MDICSLIGLMVGLGALGGLINCAISGEFHLPHTDKEAKIWRPGWVGNVLVGGVAAVVVWGIYGPLASFDLLGGQNLDPHLTLAQLFSSLVVGLGGGRILSLEAQKLILRSEKEAEKGAKIVLAETLRSTLREGEGQ